MLPQPTFLLYSKHLVVVLDTCWCICGWSAAIQHANQENFFSLFLSLKTKTGICLLQDGNQEPFKVRLHLAKDILMIQEQDVICVSGEPFYSGVSSFYLFF